MQLYLLIAAGGALGSVLRYFINGLVSDHLGVTFPWGTLVINITGSFLIGFIFDFTGPAGRATAGAETRLFLMTGICGGYTTFSSFSLQTLNLVREGEWLRAGANAAASVFCCMVAVWMGHLLAARLNSIPA